MHLHTARSFAFSATVFGFKEKLGERNCVAPPPECPTPQQGDKRLENMVLRMQLPKVLTMFIAGRECSYWANQSAGPFAWPRTSFSVVNGLICPQTALSQRLCVTTPGSTFKVKRAS
jgi:hypothetical protein